MTTINRKQYQTGMCVAGRVQYNKEPASSKVYANLVRLSPREDALEESLTVVQNMQLAAHLSLPPHFTAHRRASLIEEVLDLLALRPLQHCLVGSPLTPGNNALASCASTDAVLHRGVLLRIGVMEM